MTFTATKLIDLPLKTSLPLTSHRSLFFSTPKPSFHTLRKRVSLSPSSTLRTNKNPTTQKNPNSPWLSNWPPPNSPIENTPRKVTPSNGQDKTHFFKQDKGQNAIERIVLRLRNLGLGSDDEEEEVEEENKINGGDLTPVTGEERLGDLLKREWVRPDAIFRNDNKSDDDDLVLPWEREEKEGEEIEGEKWRERKRRVKAPTLAELTIEDEELRRLRKMGMFIRERISVPKAGLTREVLDKIHDKWRKEELVRLKFHEVLAHDMKTAHEIVEVGSLKFFSPLSLWVCFFLLNVKHYYAIFRC